MPKRDSLVLLNDICTALGRISSYVQGMDKDSFLNDQKTIDAVTRNLEIVGEAAFQMDEVIKNRFPDIPWHRIVHDYFGVDTSLIWGIATKDVEELANILRKYTSC